MEVLEKLKKDVIVSIRKLIETGTSKRKIETDLGMPANCLSSILSGKKELSTKWVDPLKTYCENASEKIDFVEGKWYTMQNGKIIEVTDEMIKERTQATLALSLPSNPVNVITDMANPATSIKDLCKKPATSNYTIDTTKKKPDNGYDPMKNPLFKKKHGLQ